MELLKYVEPHGTAWELLVSAIVVVAGPIVFERLRIPGLIGLLAGGCLIGPNVLGVVGSGEGVLHQFGELGLLYLMFVAGLELDFAVFGRYRRQAVGFSLLTFAIPLGLGFGGGQLVGYGVAASILLGSLFASYTLVVYPIVRSLGIAANGAVATTVGATVITDTLALVVLAAVAGSATGDTSGGELASQIVLGLAILGGYCFLVLPRLAAWFFAGFGAQRTIRYAFVLACLLSGGVLAEVLGIEAIVGAFFAGLALNRLVPNEGEFMERIEFFGSALLIPLFLVSVGTVIDPAVLIDPGTLGVAVVFTVACIGGKLIAAVACRPWFGFSWPEVGVVFGLSVAQAAATLAATFVGLQIGLFTTTTVNAVMIVIVVSLVLASLAAQRAGRLVPRPADDTSRYGRCVLTHVEDPADADVVIGIAARLAAADAGIVRPTAIVPDGQDEVPPELVHATHAAVARIGIDAELDIRHDRSVNDGILHAASSCRASATVVAAATQSWLPTLLGAAQHALVATSPVPTVLVRAGTAAPTRVVLVLSTTQAKRPASATLLATTLAARLRSSGLPGLVVAAATPAAAIEHLLDGGFPVEVVSPTEWIAANAAPTDLLVVPGGRNGALSTARAAKASSTRGSTFVVAADRESVAAADRAAQSGLVLARSAR